MSKEKTIPDPPAHIKRCIEEEWDRDAEWNEGNRSKYSFRLGALIMHQKCEEEKEEHAIGFIEWASDHYDTYSTGIWWGRSEGDLEPHNTKYIYDLYIESLNPQ